MRGRRGRATEEEDGGRRRLASRRRGCWRPPWPPAHVGEGERESEHEREEGKRSFVKEKTKLSIYLFGWIPTRSGRSEKEVEQKPDKVRRSRRISFR